MKAGECSAFNIPETRNMKQLKLAGLIAAPFTPFDERGEVNYAMIEKQAANLIADGVNGAYVCGTTDEGISCSVEERMCLMEAWKNASRGKLVLIAHTGALSLKDAAVLSRKAVELGYDAFSVIPPTFFKPGTEAALVDYCAEVAAFAPELPFYYYHTMNSGVNLWMPRFLELAESRIPNLGGIKFNHHNLYEYQNCLYACGGKYDIVFGVDEFFAGALALGAKAFIGSTYNYSACLYQKVWKAFDAGDWQTVALNMRKICRGVDLLNANGGIPAGKSMMLVKGIECGKARLPLKQLSGAERRAIADAMKRIIEE